MDQIALLVDQLGIDCELTRGPAFVYSAGNLQREADIAWDLGLPAQLAGPDKTGLPGQGTSAVRFDNQLMLHPVRYLAGLGPRVSALHAVVATLLPIGTLGRYFARTRPRPA